MEVRANKGKIILVVVIRLVVLSFFLIGIYAASMSNPDPNMGIFIVFVILALLFTLSPLRHWNEVFVLAPGKITLKKKEFTFVEPAEIKWVRRKTYLIGTRLNCYKAKEKTGLKEIIFSFKYEMDLTYIKNPHEEFINYYINKRQGSLSYV